jgi:hypothetical protein
MRYIYESLFVGVYSCILYLLVPINDAKIALFVVGFLKHYLGNWLGIQDYYCNNGYSCNSKRPSKYLLTQTALILESVVEGGLFLIFGVLLMMIQKNMIVTYFIIGMLLHLIFEFSGAHQKICAYRCKRP